VRRRRIAVAVLALLIAGIGGTIFFQGSSEAQPPIVRIDRIHVDKSAHLMTVFAKGRAVRSFEVALGRGGIEPKEQEGDGRVPEGSYLITGRNPESAFHRSLRIGYPTPAQAALARKQDVDPGGDIMIHGLPSGRGWLNERHRLIDWTQGCVAVTNAEMDWLWQAVPDGTPIEIVQ
jgi:murein L,D-transpeptidase YafK